MPKIHYLTYNNISTRTMGIYITGSGTYNAAELDATSYTIPGRNGDLVIPNGRWKNIRVVYPAFIPAGFESQVQKIRDMMRRFTTYKVLQDDYDTNHFRLAIPSGLLEFEPVNQNDAANFQLVFNCKPQRFLQNGETMTALSATNKPFFNPTYFDALPLITWENPAAGDSVTVVSGKTYTITALQSYSGTVTIDSETQNIYSGAVNLNNAFDGDFPVIQGQPAAIARASKTGSGTVYLKPRWWEL